MILYNLGIHAFNGILHLAAMFKPKAKLWVNGRKLWRPKLEQLVNEKNLNGCIWLHAASLGEFEQGRPVIEKIKQEFPNQKIVITFFSPSGFEIQKNYPLADLVIYLPIDTKSNAKKFLKILQPKVAIFVKYEFWLNYLYQLKKNNIPTFLISTVIKPHQSFFKWYGGNFRKALQTYHTIFTQDVYSLRLLKLLKFERGILAGDTRFDRVLQICNAPKQLPEIAEFSKNSLVIIAGSSWQKDEEFLLEAYIKIKQEKNNIKLIIAPHEIQKQNIDRLQNLLHSYQIKHHLYTDNLSQLTNDVLIVNTIGLLSSIYQYGKIALVGGGFNGGIHNILEPTVYGLPVLFGPNFAKFNEAFEIIDLKAGFTYQNAQELKSLLNSLVSNETTLNETSTLAANYVRKNSGATNKIVDSLRDFL